MGEMRNVSKILVGNVKKILILNIKKNTKPDMMENLQACAEFTALGGVFLKHGNECLGSE